MQKLKLKKCWRALLLILCMSAYAINLSAQTTIKGKVVDENGQPLPGATVKYKTGINAAVSTDNNGAFSIAAPSSNNSLLVSFIGYVTLEFPVTPNSRNLTISLKPNSKSLNEVVVVGYGTQKKSDVTGAVSTIKATQLQEVPAPNIVDQLKGRIAGLDIQSNATSPGSAGQIRLRGERSLGTTQGAADAQNGPLFVVDGVPFVGGSFNDLNQDDIASVDVLKDASATAIYGSRASGGVILITTKRGNKSGKATVSVNSYYGLTKITKEYPIMNGAEFAAFSNLAATVGGTSQYALPPAQIAGLAAGVNTDWQQFIFRRGYTTDNEVNVSGGNEATQFSTSIGYHKELGTQIGQDFDRYSIRTTLDHQFNDRVKVGINTFETLSHIDGAGLSPLYNTVALSPLVSPYNADGSVNLLPAAGTIDASRISPITVNNSNIQNLNRRISSFNSLYGEVKIVDGLKYRLNVGLTYGQSQGNNYLPVGTIYNTATASSQTNESVSNSQNWTYLIENLLTYDKTFNKVNHITFTGLYSVERDHTDGLTLNGVGLPTDYLQSYNLALTNSINVTNPIYTERGLVSYMARLNYAFNDKYLLTATVRSDGASVLSANNQFFTYPAFALGWNVDKEDFMKKLTFINALKVRAGFGVTADQNIAPYQILGSLSTNYYNYGSGANAGQTGILVTTLPSPNLKFEHTDNINLGVDFGLFGDRITGTVDVYQQKTHDILQTINLPVSNGAATTLINAGDTKGSGLEIALSTVNIRTPNKGFSWSTDFNIAFNRNSIVALHDGLKSDLANGWFVGQPFNVIYDYRNIGIWQTSEATQAAVYGQKPGQIKVQDVDNNGKIDQNDAQILGNYQPQYTGGITNRFTFKGVDLTFVTFARMGQKVAVTYLGADSQGAGFPYAFTGRANQYRVDYWTPTNPTNAFPEPNANTTSPMYGSTLQYRDGSFIKMRSINLGYNLPNEMIKKAGFSSLHVYVTVLNPFIIYSPLVKSGLAIDPEGNGYGNVVTGASNASANTVGRGISVGLSNPPTRSFQIGVNAKF